ncbi:MAG TPA: hypothetical protein PK953_04680 [Smithellaceae bacterium]|jgi:hypothetical protein|nr:hypothetical protein [Bacillota bacterium]HQC10190.1 hypothetical protein [Smithellaceae bacterium]
MAKKRKAAEPESLRVVADSGTAEHKAVAVIWYDASCNNGWMSHHDADACQPMKTVSFGMLISEEDNIVVSMTANANNITEVLSIPCGWVKKIIPLTASDDTESIDLDDDEE